MRVILLLLIMFFFQCSEEKRENVKIHNIKGILLYEFQCNGKVYFALENGKCEDLPQSYFSPIGDSEYYYTISFRVKNGKLELYSFYNDLTKKGDIEKQIKIREYEYYRDNIAIIDTLQEKDKYTISGSTVRW